MSTSASSERSTASGRWASLRAGLEDFSAPFRARAGRLYRRGLKADLWDVPVMLLVTTLGLAIFGCIMVLSASSVTMISQGQSPFSQVSSQIMFLVLGVLAMAGITRIPVGVYHKKFVVYAMLATALVMQLAVVVVGVEVNGNRNWLKLGPVQIQPSEFSKLAIIMWLAWVYSRHGDISRSIWRTLFPSIYGVGALVLLIMLGGDMGTAMVYGFIFVGMMWLAGASRSSLLKIGGAFAALALVGVLTGWFPQLEFIAEDLGYPTPEVAQLLRDSGLPGMKVLEFAFDSRDTSSYLPHSYRENCICYTGTHDNSPLALWRQEADPADIAFAKEYLGLNDEEGFNRGIIRGGMSSVAKLFVAQMQDYLELGAGHRTNEPGTQSGNWQWRMLPGELTPELAQRIRKLTRIYGRLA